MKRILIVYLLLLPFITFGQKKIDTNKLYKLLADKLAPLDLSGVLKSESAVIVGFIGSNYQRIQIHYSSIVKDKSKPDEYLVKGKSKVKDNVCDFTGVITITKTIENEQYTGDTGKAAMYVNLDSVREGTLTAHYNFKEDSTQKFSGIFDGTLTSDFYLDINYKPHYDNTMQGADDYSNNQFTGTWIMYGGKLIKKCNWGDYRIPDCGNLDVGVGNFTPDQKYIKNGWQNYCTGCPDDSNKTKNWWQ
ncbi:MAG TPA: hypothetical protein VK783_01090 [Bacteroidia bacterium]|nr:hypothetical protein [Bacteroidia bacterium]